VQLRIESFVESIEEEYRIMRLEAARGSSFCLWILIWRLCILLAGQLLGLPSFVPVFMNPATKGKVILQGVNYASGGAGILDFTGYAFVSRDTIVFFCCLPLEYRKFTKVESP
jgi:hypothetical protein